MKKVISMLLAVVLVLALSVSAFAVTDKQLSDAFTVAKPYMNQEQQNAVRDVRAQINSADITDAQLTTIKETLKGLNAANGANTLDAGKINSAISTINGALSGTGVTVAVANISVNGGTINADVTATQNGKGIASARVDGKTAQPAAATTTTAAAVTTGVIKATGMNMVNAALALAIAVVGVLGFAVIKNRKAGACA